MYMYVSHTRTPSSHVATATYHMAPESSLGGEALVAGVALVPLDAGVAAQVALQSLPGAHALVALRALVGCQVQVRLHVL